MTGRKMEFGLSFDGLTPAPEFVSLAVEAEGAGVSSFWLSEHIGYRDTFVTAAQLLVRTQQARVVPTAVSPYVKHPMAIAMGMGSLHELGPGRVGVTLGTGQPRDVGSIGLAVEKPLATMREAVQVLRLLLAPPEGGPGRASFAGDRFRLDEAQLQPALRHGAPIYLAAVGEKMLRLAGELADGVTLSLGCSPEYIGWAGGQVLAGARAAGRDSASLHVNAYILVSIDDDEEVALEQARRKLAFILRGAHHARNLELSGMEVDQPALARAVVEGDDAAIRRLLPAEVVRAHSVTGTPSNFRPVWERYLAGGIDTAILSPVGGMESRLRAVRLITGAA